MIGIVDRVSSLPPSPKKKGAVHLSALDRPHHRGPHHSMAPTNGRLPVGAFLTNVGRGTPESHACPQHGCVGELASLSHVMFTCPVFFSFFRQCGNGSPAPGQPSASRSRHYSMPRPESYRTRPCLCSYSQARQFHLVRGGSQVSGFTFAVISRGRCT